MKDEKKKRKNHSLTEIDVRSSIRMHLVEEEIPKQLEKEAITCLRPAGVSLEFRPLVDESELHEQPEKASVLRLPLQLVEESVRVGIHP